MRKGSRTHSKKVTIPEEDEEEKFRKTEGKKAIIRAEFEKHKKELMISDSEASKLNEIRLKNQLEELLTENTRKMQNLARLENSEVNLREEVMEATQFNETICKFETSKTNDPYLSVGFHPVRTPAPIYGMTEENQAELLGDKMAKLMETLSNIELMIEEEEEIRSSIQDKYNELKKDQILSSKKVNELTKMNDHADKRFTDLERMEFLAHTKYAAATSDLKEFKDDLRDLKSQELVYKKQKEEEKRRETDYLHAKQNEISNVLIELDSKRQEFHHVIEEVKRLELKHEEMRDKRKNTKIVTRYIKTFNALNAKQINLVDAYQALREASERLDDSRENSPSKEPNSLRNSFLNPDGSPRKSSKAGDDTKLPLVKRNSVVDRNSYIEEIRKLYERHPEGPEKLADTLIQEFMRHCYHEESLKSNYEELQDNKRKQQHELQALEEELKLLKGKNEYIILGKSGSKILDNNEQEAIDSGMLIVDSLPTTLNQAKFEFENKKEADNHTVVFIKTESFVLRCYLDSIEMISRFSKMLLSVYQQSNGNLSEEMRELSRNTHIQASILKKSKKFKPEMTLSQVFAEALPELQRVQTDSSSVSEKEREPQEPIITLDLNEVHDLFLSIFEDENERAAEFVENLKNDVMIMTFITIEDIKSYLQACRSDGFTESNIQRVLVRTNYLRKTAIENMLQKLEIIYKTYSDIVTTSRKSADSVYYYLKERGVEIPKEDLLGREAESNVFIKKATQRKWQKLLDRYDYDPSRDFRKATQETETSVNDITQNIKEKPEEEKDIKEEFWDKEDTKAKLNEIVDAMSKKPAFKGRNEEDKKRLQAKIEKEKQKQAIENMNDDDYLEYQRNQIRNDGKADDLFKELNEAELLRKAQADLTLRLSSSAAPIGELRRMIQNSKVLSKIQILEKQKCSTDGKRTLKYEPSENYIPHEPIKVPKSPPHSANQTYKTRFSRTFYSPTNKSSGNKFFTTSTDRMTESEYFDTPKSMTMTLKTAFSPSTSKFKPIDARFDFISEPTQENEKPQTQIGSKRLRTLDNFKTMPSLLSKPIQQNEIKESKSKRFLLEPQKKNSEPRDLSLPKNKIAKSELPKLGKNNKKKNKANKKKKNHSEVTSNEHEHVDNFLRIQTDPLLKMVYSPTFFANSVQGSVYSPEDLGYRFDAFKFNTPGLLFSEKVHY